jgi:fibro-slime domain-containing protein
MVMRFQPRWVRVIIRYGVMRCALAAMVLLPACGESAESRVAASGGSATSDGGGPSLDIVGSIGGASGSSGNAAESSGGSQVVTSLPAGFTQTDIGGYQLGAALTTNGGGGTAGGGSAGGSGAKTGNCGNVLEGVVRDFKGANQPGGHPDFEASIYGNDVTPNLVAQTLGADQKPIYASMCEIGHPSPPPICPFGAETTTEANFNEWYRDTPGVNLPYAVSLYLAPQAGGLFTFQSLEYFPLDNAGFGDSAIGDDGKMHNFSFTTEVHTQFLYSGGETFQFQGDDDVWVFINDKLAVDLGGLHPKTLRNVSLDAAAAQLGITTGNVYDLDLFHAERHTTQSTFRIDTNLSFVNCGTAISGAIK